ncbi:MAG: hypothetical protein FK732_03010 [Asgard group archaeon]|nr:hypothetical protein [Asgard group archaeon]
MTLSKSCNAEPPTKTKSADSLSNDDCLICRISRIRHERPDIVKWYFSSDKPQQEKIKLATLLTGIKFDKEIVDYLNDPHVQQFVFSE